MKIGKLACGMTALALAVSGAIAGASSHREAPFVTERPKTDGTDFYMFRSYEAGRDGMVTLIANYLPLQDAYGGPNYFSLDPEALYEIMVDNNGDAQEDITFQFRFTNTYKNLTVPVGGRNIPVPLINIGPIGPGITGGDATKNLVETYSVTVVRGDRRTGTATAAGTFTKPTDNIGNKSIPAYAAYANAHIATLNIPGCGAGKVFVGQRQESFAVNLGEVFDLVNLNPVGPRDAKPSTIANKNITSLALEVPVACLTAGGQAIVGGWTTASLRQGLVYNPSPKGLIAGLPTAKAATIEGGAWTQVSRLGAPLVNELVIGLPDKDRFNSSAPRDDGQFAPYVTNPSLPTLLQVLFEVPAPTTFPRTDLVAAFLTGVTGLNQPPNVVASEMLRLNTGIAPKAAAAQSNLGVLGNDTAGFPNGRRPGDDVVDIELRVAMGVLLPEAQAPAGQAPFTDQTLQDASPFTSVFPYLNTPLPGSPQGATPLAGGSQ